MGLLSADEEVVQLGKVVQAGEGTGQSLSHGSPDIWGHHSLWGAVLCIERLLAASLVSTI